MLEDGEEVAELAVLGLQVSHRHRRVDPVVVPSPDLRACEVPRVDQVGNDPLHRSLGDPEAPRHIDHALLGVLGDAE